MALYLVIGGAGFIGSHLADALIARADRLRVLDDLSSGRIENLPHDAEFIDGDVSDAAQTSRAMQGVAGCFHLAAIASVTRSNEDWLSTHRTNLTGTATALEAARAAGKTPVVYASSAAISGNPASMPSTGSTIARPLTAYGADKLGSELYAEVGRLVHGIPTFGCRFFNVYGPRWRRGVSARTWPVVCMSCRSKCRRCGIAAPI